MNDRQLIARRTAVASLSMLVLLPCIALAESAPRKEDDITATTLALVDRALLAYDTTEARKLVDPIAAMANRDAFVALALGRVQEQEQEYTDATKHLKRATELAPSDPAMFLSLGEVELRTKHDWNAAVAFKRAFDLARAKVRAEPANANAYVLLGLAEQRLQHYDQALGSFDEALALDPHNVTATYQEGVTMTFQKRWKDAVDLLTTAIDQDPRIAYAYYYRGLAAGHLGRNELLIADLTHFLEMAPRAPEAGEARTALAGARPEAAAATATPRP